MLARYCFDDGYQQYRKTKFTLLLKQCCTNSSTLIIITRAGRTVVPYEFYKISNVVYNFESVWSDIGPMSHLYLGSVQFLCNLPD